MDRLPPEIKQYICSFLTSNHLKALRLVSKNFAAAAIPHFIPRIFLFNHPDSCTEIQEIIKHTEMRKYVNTIVIDPRDVLHFDGFEDWVDHMPAHWRIPHWKDYEPQFPPEADIDGIVKTWNQAMETARELYLDHFKDAKYSESELRSLWEYHHILQHKQRRGFLKRSSVSIIQETFKQCPKLENVVVTSERYPESAMVSLKRDKLFRPILLAFAIPNSHARIPLSVINLNLDDIVVSNNLSTLTILHIEFPMTASHSTMSNLRHLHVSFRACERDPNVLLDQILRSTRRLETLWLDYPLSKSGIAFDLNSTLRATKFDNLRECLLAGCLVSENQLVDFLLRHASSLQTLGLGEVQLVGGTWPSLFRRISCRLPVLTKISLVGLCAGPGYANEHADRYTRVAQDYILHGGSEPVEFLVEDEDSDEDSIDFPSIITETQKGLWKDIDVRVNPFF